MTEYGDAALAASALCPSGGGGLVFGETLRSLGIEPQTLYDDARGIALAAREIRAASGQDFCALPFCHTTEAAAMGADIRPADSTAGPRPGGYVLTGVDGLHEAVIADSPAVRNLLSACRIFKGDGESVVYEICGPISILSCMMDLSVLFRQWRSEADSVLRAMRRISGILLDFLPEICRAGADCVSFADPAGNPQILGPRHSGWLAEQFTLPFLRAAASICGGHGTALSLCPLAAAGLSGTGVLLSPGDVPGQIAVCCVNTAKRIPPMTYRIKDVEP